MDILEILLVIGVGIVAGALNTLAGGGSLLTLPMFIFLGLPPSVANATNRVAIFFQTVTGVAGFKSKGVSVFPYNLWLGLAAIPGAIIGAKVAVDIRGDVFNKILAVIMIIVVLMIVFKKKNTGQEQKERTGTKHTIIGLVVFFFIGFYGGFIHAGVGYLMIAALTGINGFSLVKTNSIKVFVAAVYTAAALGVFILEGQVMWIYGLTLAIGNSTGAWFASRYSVAKGDKVIKPVLLVSVVILAIKLWFF